jgi:glycopeptide antibiotics resistance protein
MTDAPDVLSTPRRPLGTGTFALLTLGFLFFVVYGSLVPFHYRPLGWGETFARWHEVLAQPLGVDSRVDFASNVLLFIPLGFLMAGTCSVDRHRAVAVLAVFLVTPVCAALSASIEFAQLWFPPRVSSINDVFAETIGGATGALLWATAGQRVTAYARSVWGAAGPENLAVRVLPAYLLVLAVIHALPLDLTISPAELYHKWKEGRIALVPFAAEHGGALRVALKTGWNVAYFLPLGVILACWPGPRFRRWPPVLAAGILTASAVEFMQLFVWSRNCDATDVLTGSAAVWLGWWLTGALTVRRTAAASRGRRFPSALTRPCLFLAWFLVAAVVNWVPADLITEEEEAVPPRAPAEAAWQAEAWVVSHDGRFVRPPDRGEAIPVRRLGPFVVLVHPGVVRQRLLNTPPVPLQDLWVGSPFHAADEVLHKMLLFLPLGALLVPRPTAKGRRGVWRALLAGFFLASLFEAGQLLVPGRTCSTSDILIETNGAVVGFLLYRRLLILGSRRPAAELPPAPGGEGPRRIPVGLGVFITEEGAGPS